MSRSMNADVVTPVKKSYEWSGSEGKLKSYNRETKENELFDLPFTFLVLDKLSTIVGFYEKENSGFWSNEIRNTKTDVLTVRTKKGIEQEGLYADLTPTLNKGAKYAQSVYIAFYDENKEMQIGNLRLFGSGLGPWIDFCKEKDVYKVAVTISGAEAAKKGATKYFTPVFEAKEVSDETNKLAAKLDAELQVYLTAMLSRNGSGTERVNYSAPINKMTPNTSAGDETPARDGKIYSNASQVDPDDSGLPF